MRKNKILSYWFVLGLLSVLLGLGPGCDSAKPVQGKAKILIAPAPFSLSMMEARFLFLTDYLTKQTGWKIESVGAPSSLNEFLKIVEREKVALSFQNPYFYLFLAEKFGATPVLKTWSIDNLPEYRGIIISPQKSPIRSPNDLIGKKILASNRHSLGGFLAQFIFLKDSGIDPDRDLIYQFGDTQEKILEKVAAGQAEAGFIREDVLQAMVRAQGEVSGVKVIASTLYHPTHCLVKYPQTDPVLVEKVKAALLKLNPGNPDDRFILDRLRISRFEGAFPDDYLNFKKVLSLHGLFPGGPNSSPPASE